MRNSENGGGRAQVLEHEAQFPDSGRGVRLSALYRPARASSLNPDSEEDHGPLRNGAPFATMPAALVQLQAILLRYPGGDRVMAQVLSAVTQHRVEAVLVSRPSRAGRRRADSLIRLAVLKRGAALRHLGEALNQVRKSEYARLAPTHRPRAPRYCNPPP